MEAILSSAFKNSNIRFIEFLPEIGFGLFSFGVIQEDSLELDDDREYEKQNGSGIRRERIDVTEHVEEQQVKQFSLSSSLPLDDRLVPDGIGTLEQISYGKRKTAEPQIVALSYLFFDRQSTHFFHNANPIRPLYPYFALRKSFPYIGRYKTIAPAAEYFTEAPYEPAESPKQHPYAINYPLVHMALLGQFDPAKESYKMAILSAPRLTLPTEVVYVSYAGYAPTIAIPLTIQQSKPVEIAVAFTKSSNIYTLLTQQAHSAQPKPETSKSYDRTKILFENQEAKPILHISPTLEENVRSIYRSPSVPRQEIYDTNSHYRIRISPSHNPTQQTKTSELGIESRLKAFFVDRIYQESDTRKAYGSKQKQYTGINQPQQNTPYKIGTSIFPRNYDMPSEWINVMGSDLWKRKASLYTWEAKYTKPQTKGQSSELREEDAKTAKIKPIKEIEDKSEPQENPLYEKEINQRTDDEISTEGNLPKPEYEQNKINQNDNSAKSDKGIKSNYQSKKDNKKTKAGRSILSYAAAGIAIAGLFGLATLAYPLASTKAREIERTKLYHVSEDKSASQSPISQVKTIDSVVVPPINNETVFTQEFRENIESLIKRVEQLGYGNVSISIRNNLTGEYYGYNDRKPKPQPSHAKIAIAFAEAYLAQNGLLDLKKKIDFDPDLDKDLILERELADYPEFKFKNQFDYSFLQKLMIRDSANTPTNLILKFIGNGDVYEGMKIVNNVMREIGLGDIKVEVPYNRIFEYTKNVATTEAIERLMGYLLKGEHLKPEYSSPIKDDLQNERWMKAFRDRLQGITSGTKVHIHKHGTGFAAYLGDYSVAVSFDDSKTELYTDEARSAKHLFQDLNEINEKRVTKPIYTASNHEFGEIFNLLRMHLFNLDYQQPNKKAA